ncbi:MAG: hypothetical protein WDN23_13085 [Edaphobacter sp.]
MIFAWEHLIWRRTAQLQVELPLHGPPLATLIKLIAKAQVFIADVDVERLSSVMSFQPGMFTHKPAVVTIAVRTKSRNQEERLLRALTNSGYSYKRE